MAPAELINIPITGSTDTMRRDRLGHLQEELISNHDRKTRYLTHVSASGSHVTVWEMPNYKNNEHMAKVKCQCSLCRPWAYGGGHTVWGRARFGSVCRVLCLTTTQSAFTVNRFIWLNSAPGDKHFNVFNLRKRAANINSFIKPLWFVSTTGAAADSYTSLSTSQSFQHNFWFPETVIPILSRNAGPSLPAPRFLLSSLLWHNSKSNSLFPA